MKGAGAKIDGVMHRFGRAVVLLLTLAILWSGPIAACVCAGDQSMPAMPCCPDQVHHAGQHDLGVPPSFDVSCAQAAVTLLPTSVQEQLAPAAIVAAVPEQWRTRAPPPLPTPELRPRLDTPPIYLATLRLRI